MRSCGCEPAEESAPLVEGGSLVVHPLMPWGSAGEDGDGSGVHNKCCKGGDVKQSAPASAHGPSDESRQPGEAAQRHEQKRGRKTALQLVGSSWLGPPSWSGTPRRVHAICVPD